MVKKNNSILDSYEKSVRTTAIYHAGKILADARHSFIHAILVPLKLINLLLKFKKIDGKVKNLNLKTENNFESSITALKLIKDKDPEDILIDMKSMIKSNEVSSSVILELANIFSSSNKKLTIHLLELLISKDKKDYIQKRIAFLEYENGNLIKSSGLLKNEKVNRSLNATEIIQSRKIIDESSILQNGLFIPNKSSSREVSRSTKVLFVCHTTLHHHTNGYSVRTQNIVKSIKGLGIEVQCIARPGYPWDRKDAKNIFKAVSRQEYDGINYYYYNNCNIQQNNFTNFSEKASRCIQEHIEKHSITHVIAASNYINAVPALMAARLSGIPFIYDVRGLWEYTKATKILAWKNSERFNLSKRLETLVASHADHVITISSQLKDKLIDRGIKASKILISNNGAKAWPLKEASKNKEIKSTSDPTKVIGFIGSMEHYEGLDILILSLKKLIDDGIDVKLILVGSGPEAQNLHELACRENISDRVDFVGRVAYENIPYYYSLIDVCVYPRRSYELCKIVPPLKPLEAMAFEKPVFISNLAPLMELTGGNTFIFKSECPISLYKTLKDNINDDQKLKDKKEEAAEFVENERNWVKSSQPYIEALSLPHQVIS